MPYEEWIARLDALSDPTVSAYQRKVITDTAYPMKNIRMQPLRSLAQEAAKGEWEKLLLDAKWESFEEVMLLGLAIAYAAVPFSQKEEALKTLLPRLDSWALTDSIVPTLKFTESEESEGWAFALQCLSDNRTYTIRFGIVMLLTHFLKPAYLKEVAQHLIKLKDERYYVKMAVAWCLAEIAVQDYPLVEGILDSCELDSVTHNMTIRKIRESNRIPKEQKAAAAARKRKEQ